MRLNLGLAIMLVAAFVGCAGTNLEEQTQMAYNLTKEHFKNTATIKDDPLDTLATITTLNGFQFKYGRDTVLNDNFLRAFINKKTGTTTIQLYQVIYYHGGGWNFFQTINYETPSGPEARRVKVISRNVDCSGSHYYGGCTYTEHLAFEIEEEFLRIIAAGYQPGQHVTWKFKFKAKSGREYKDGMLPAEIAGFLEAIDAYRASCGLTNAASK